MKYFAEKLEVGAVERFGWIENNSGQLFAAWFKGNQIVNLEPSVFKNLADVNTGFAGTNEEAVEVDINGNLI